MTDPVSREYRGNALILTVDNPPVNVISQAVRASLLAACAEAKAALEAGRIERVVVTGAGRSFVAGADAKEFDGPALDPQLPDVLNALAELPAIAAINGAALGGGYEIALACRYRIAAPAAMIGLPEVTLGVVPGSGGTQRLPRLIGLDKALPLISTGAVLKGKAALAQGMVDALAEDPLDAALALDLSNLGPAIADLPAPAAAPEAAQAARDTAKKRMRGQIAPLKAIELMEHAATLPLPEGMAAERAAFLDLRAGEQARALRHIFFAERGAGASAELKKLDPAPVDHVLVAGGGTMGAAIAYALNSAGIEITLLENDAEAETRARANVQKLFDEAVSRGKLDAAESIRRKSETFHFISGADTPLPPVDMVIEAVFENLDVKRALFTRLAAGLPEDTILATNTSYLDVNRIAEVVLEPLALSWPAFLCARPSDEAGRGDPGRGHVEADPRHRLRPDQTAEQDRGRGRGLRRLHRQPHPDPLSPDGGCDPAGRGAAGTGGQGRDRLWHGHGALRGAGSVRPRHRLCQPQAQARRGRDFQGPLRPRRRPHGRRPEAAWPQDRRGLV